VPVNFIRIDVLDDVGGIEVREAAREAAGARRHEDDGEGREVALGVGDQARAWRWVGQIGIDEEGRKGDAVDSDDGGLVLHSSIMPQTSLRHLGFNEARQEACLRLKSAFISEGRAGTCRSRRVDMTERNAALA